MALVIGKSFKFTRILNLRLSFNSAKSLSNTKRLVKLYDCSKNGKVGYATAAHKYLTNDEPPMKKDFTTSHYENIVSLDDALSKIDFQVRRNGRIFGKHLVNVFSMVTDKEMTSSTHGLYLLRSCKYCYSEHPSKRIELVNKIWNRYQELGIPFDARHYNALLDVHISNCLDFDPVEILKSMEDNKIEPNKATYILVMKKYCENGDINGASEILGHMKEKGLPANEDVFNNLIQGHVKNNDFDGAKDMIKVMRSSNLQPNENTYTILACGYAAAGNKDEMMKYLKEIDPAVNASGYLKVVETLASSGNHQLIDEVISMVMHPEKFPQDFINSAVELIHKGFIETAHKLIVLSFTPEYDQGVLIFLKQIIKVGRPVSEVLEFCTRLHTENYSSILFPSAAKAAVESERHDCIVPIFKKMIELGQFIRPSSFWPLFASLKDEKSSDGIWLLLKHMHDIGVPADITTFSNVIYPMLGTPQPNAVIEKVEQSGHAKEVAADALFLHYCNVGKIDYALQLTEMIPVHLSDKFSVEGFVNIYNDLNRDAVQKYYKVLKYVFTDENYLSVHCEVQGRLLAELISKQPRVLEMLLEKYIDLSFSPKALRFCERVLLQMKPVKREHLMVVDRLHNLTQERELFYKDLSVEEEEKQIKYLQKHKAKCKPFLTRRLRYHIKAKNISRVSELLSISDELNVTFSPLLYSSLFTLYCMASDVEKATRQFQYMKTNFPSFVLDLAHILEYVTLLVKYQKFDESIEVMKSIKEPFLYVQKEAVLKKLRLLNFALSTTADIEFAKKMQELLVSVSKEFKSDKAFMNSVLQFHLQRDDLSAAYGEFRKNINTYHTTAGLNTFLRKCIHLNAKDMLQKVIDLTVSHAGEGYALLELALAFIETRHVDRAAAVINSLKQGADPKVVEDICQRLRTQNKIIELENFIRVTRPLNHPNRESLYCLAIKAYAMKQDFDKASELFEKLKKEVGDPSQKTISLMQELLEKNNQPIPLSLLSKPTPDRSPESIEATKTFMKHLEEGSAEAALTELKDMKKGYIRTLPMKTLTDLVDLCLEQKSIGDLSQNVQLMSYILDNMRDVFKPLLEKYSASGDVDKFMEISRFFPDFSLINIGFNYYFCKSFISSGKLEELLSHLEQRYDKKNKLFSIASFEELLKCPEYEDRVFTLAKNYYNSKFVLPMSIIWAHYFSKENYEKADEIFQKFTVALDKADNAVIRAIKQNENVDLAHKYVTMIKSLNVRNRQKERAYGAALDVLVLKGMNDEAVALVQEAEKLGLQLHKYYLSTLVTLKSVLEKENKPVLFYLPQDVLSESSSESDKE